MRSLLLPFALLLVVGMASAAQAQVRTITVTGTSSLPGTTDITIEDFDKPGRRDGRLLATGPLSTHVVSVPVSAGWDCVQTTLAIHKALTAALVPPYTVTIAPTNACQIYIERNAGGNVWSIIVIDDVPGQSVVVEEGAVPVVPATWGAIKARYTGA